MNIILDDDLENRITPIGFTRFVTGNDLLEFMSQHPQTSIRNITFDNDLGLGLPQGYDVVKELINNQWSVQAINLHSANVVAVKNMQAIIASAIRHEQIPNISVTTMPLMQYSKLWQ